MKADPEEWKGVSTTGLYNPHRKKIEFKERMKVACPVCFGPLKLCLSEDRPDPSDREAA